MVTNQGFLFLDFGEPLASVNYAARVRIRFVSGGLWAEDSLAQERSHL